jgi:ArsR family transcriptional regulator
MKRKLDLQLIQRASKVLRCIGHPDRLRIVECLESGTLPVGSMTKALGLSQVRLSKHLSVLKKHGIVSSAARANYRDYSIAYPGIIPLLNCMRQHGGKS